MNSKGMTLIEVLLSVVILLVGIMACYRPLLSSLGAMQYADERIQADHLLSNEIWSLEEKILEEGQIEGFKSNSKTIKPVTYEIASRSQYVTDTTRLSKTGVRISWRGESTPHEIKREFYLVAPRKQNAIN